MKAEHPLPMENQLYLLIEKRFSAFIESKGSIKVKAYMFLTKTKEKKNKNKKTLTVVVVFLLLSLLLQ